MLIFSNPLKPMQPGKNSFRRGLCFVLGATAATSCGWTQTPPPAHPVVLHAARLLDIEAGRIVSPGEVLIEGAKIVASKSTARLLKTNGPKQWEDASKA